MSNAKAFLLLVSLVVVFTFSVVVAVSAWEECRAHGYGWAFCLRLVAR